ncbi:MAG: hypothetical protein JNK90_28640 [Planctomycetaceae bacterium]|nr:hypothetical protein [Planctomycetaceae bacterium]
MIDLEKYVGPSEAREAIRLYRDAINRIKLLRRTAFPRWSDGLTVWFAADSPLVHRVDFLTYDEHELAIYRDARDILCESVRLNPYNPDAFILLGNACQEIDGDLSSMLFYYNLAISLDPNNDEFYNCRMAYFLATNNLPLALIDLEHLDRLHSEYAESKRMHYEKAMTER